MVKRDVSTFRQIGEGSLEICNCSVWAVISITAKSCLQENLNRNAHKTEGKLAESFANLQRAEHDRMCFVQVFYLVLVPFNYLKTLDNADPASDDKHEDLQTERKEIRTKL